MSYAKAMKFNKRRNRASQPMLFSTLTTNQRRIDPWLGSSYYEEGAEEKRAAFVRDYEAETERLLKENPNLELI